MRIGKKSLFSSVKAFFQAVTKILYIFLSAISLLVILVEVIDSGGVYDKSVVFIAFWGLVLAFICWLCHIWIKHTQYIGLCFVLVSLFYGGLYFFGNLNSHKVTRMSTEQLN